MRASDPLLESIGRACDGLVVTSETDAEVSAVAMQMTSRSKLSTDTVRALVGVDSSACVEEQSLSEFFEPLGGRREWHDARDAEMAQRFRRLERLLRRRLTEVRVFRFGDRSIDVWVVGRARDGRIVGVQSRLVET